MDKFAIRASEWVLWNKGDWNGDWINLVATLISRPRQTNRYHLTWNGQHFREGNEIRRARKKFETETASLEIELRDLLPVFWRATQ